MSLESAPVSVHVLRVHLPADVFARVVVNPFVQVAVPGQVTVPLAAVGIDGAAATDRFSDVRHESPVFRVGRQPNSNL